MHYNGCAITARVTMAMRVAAILICAVFVWSDTMGQDGTSVARTQLSQFVEATLSGDKNATKCNTLWETDLQNDDGNLWYQSAVKIGEHIYCSAPAIAGNALNVRCFDSASGEELSAGTVEVPDYMMSSGQNHTILASDDNGTLIALRCMTPDMSGRESEGIIRITALQTDGTAVAFGSEYVDVATEIDMVTENNADKSHMERVAYFKGDFNGGNFSFGAMIGWIDLNSNCYKQRFLEVSVADGVTEVKSSPDITAYDNDEQTNKWLDFHPVNNDYCVVTPHDGWPTLCTGTSWETIAEQMSNPTPAISGNNPTACRGFSTFTHNGHRMAVFAAHHNETDGVKFHIAEWPDLNGAPGFEALAQCWTVPADAFSHNSSFYPANYRHILLTEESATASRAATDENKTRFYVYAPGCGLAAYELNTPGITGLLTTKGATAELFLSADRKWLYVDGHQQAADAKGNSLGIRVYDLAGRMVLSSCETDKGIYIGALPQGHYIATAGAAALRIAVR